MENYSKPLSMKLFSTWEGERTAPHCIPRTCTFKLLEVKLAKPFDTEISSVTICASMSVGNFRRSLRTDEIYLNNGLAELDYCFSFQYPHYLKREENILKLSLQRRKRYRNRTILGYKTVAIGHIDLAQIMQCPADEKLKLFAKGGGFQVACVQLSQITSSPHESIKNHSGENSSTEEDELFYPSDATMLTIPSYLLPEDLDSEGEERTKKKPSKFKDDLKLKKKFNALLRKMKLNDTDEPMIDDEVGFVTQPDQYSATFSSIMRDDSDDSVHSDSDSVGTLPKPHLRPYFTADFDRDSDKESSTDEGTSSKKADHEPPSTATRKTSEENRRGSSMLGSPVSGAQRPSTRTSSAGPAPVIGDLRQDAVDEESNSVASPLRQSPTSQGSADDTRMGSFDDMSEGHNIIDQLDVIFNKGDTTSLAVPETIVLAYCKDKNCYHPIMKAMLASNACVFLHTGSDAKVFISTLVNKMQKCATRHSRLSPVKLAVIGDLSSTNVILKPLMDSLNNKSPEWIQNFQFIFIPTDPNNPISRYVSSVDESYTRLLDSLSVECETDVLAAYQRDAKDIVNLSIGRVLVTQLVNETDEDTKQFEVPFLNSVSIVFNRKSCVNCAEEDDPEKCSIHEIDIQVDYTSLHKKDANSKQMQVKGIFRELGVTRELGDQAITLKAAYRERKPKVALSRLKKQQQPDINSINCHVNSFTCMIRPHTCLTCTVRVDGEEYKNVLSLYVFPLWSPNHNFIPLLVSSPATAGVLC